MTCQRVSSAAAGARRRRRRGAFGADLRAVQQHRDPRRDGDGADAGRAVGPPLPGGPGAGRRASQRHLLGDGRVRGVPEVRGDDRDRAGRAARRGPVRAGSGCADGRRGALGRVLLRRRAGHLVSVSGSAQWRSSRTRTEPWSPAVAARNLRTPSAMASSDSSGRASSSTRHSGTRRPRGPRKGPSSAVRPTTPARTPDESASVRGRYAAGVAVGTARPRSTGSP